MNISVMNGTGFWLFHLHLTCNVVPETEEEEIDVVDAPSYLLLPVRSDMTVASEVLIFILRIIISIRPIVILMYCEPLFFIVGGLDVRSIIITLFDRPFLLVCIYIAQLLYFFILVWS